MRNKTTINCDLIKHISATLATNIANFANGSQWGR